MTALLVLIYVAFISLGLPDSLLGSVWPAMHADLGVEISLGRAAQRGGYARNRFDAA